MLIGTLPYSVIVSIHAPWEGCDKIVVDFLIGQEAVSIHAPWEGCDIAGSITKHNRATVSIHAPWEGCDVVLSMMRRAPLGFQFTHPGKGATTD